MVVGSALNNRDQIHPDKNQEHKDRKKLEEKYATVNKGKFYFALCYEQHLLTSS
jgi:hypothetical protein